jgi:hypothetical protein
MRHTLALVSAMMLAAPAPAAHAQQPTEWPASASQPAPAAMTPMPVQYRARDGEIIDSAGGDAIPALPLTVMSNGTMKYVTGGIGDEEKAQLQSMENAFNVQMLVATTTGGFIGDVTVKVVDTKDTVLFTVENAGPYFYAGLPAGTYMFEVSTPRGNLKSQKVVAPASGVTKPVVRFTE